MRSIQFHPTSMHRMSVVLGAAIACSSCDRIGSITDRPTAIWYSHAGCYGWCPSFEIHVSRDGKGVFEGHIYTAVKGKRAFSVSPQQFDAFVSDLRGARRLAKPFNKSRNVFEQIGSDFSCPPTAPYHTDDTGVFIMWSDRKGDVYYDSDFGCDSDHNKKLYAALDGAPRSLGLEKMIGKPGPTTAP